MLNEFKKALPGLLFIVLPIIVISEVLFWLESMYVQSAYHVPAPLIALMIAAIISIVVTNTLHVPARFNDGLQFTTKWLLKLGIVLYGLNFSYSLWFKPGAEWILTIGIVSVVVPILVTYVIGKFLRLDEQAGMLLAVGTGICGISAIVATQQALKSDEESAGMSLATILVFGTSVLLVYPVLAGVFSIGSTVYGIWVGASTLDLPQLVAAALQGGGQESLLAGLWVKSIRIGLLVPVILILMLRLLKHSTADSKMGRHECLRAVRVFPLFIIFFLAAILINTIFPIPVWISSPIASGFGQFLGINLANLLLTAAIVGICFRVRRDVLCRTGWKMLIVGGVAWGVQSLLILWLATRLPIPQI